MSAATLTPDVVGAKARRLVAAAERTSYDPFTDVDWPEALGDDHYFLPPELLPLYGTAVWDAMSDHERKVYSRHEVAALCASGIWFENILMQLVMRHLYDLPADDGAFRFLLLETADECRHSTMFAELIRRAGTPAYQVPRLLRGLGRFMRSTTRGPEAYIAMLAAEELLDASNKATMRDELVDPTSRRVAQIHVAEEARHVSFARAYAAEVWPTVSGLRRVVSMIRAPFVVRGIADALVNPAVYDELGIEHGARIARQNPRHRERVVRDLGKLTDFLGEIGVVNRWTEPIWRLLGLV